MTKVTSLLAMTCVLLFTMSVAYAGPEDVARLHLTAGEEAPGWFEGFGEAVDGESLQYRCQRSEMAPARIVRASDGETFIEWKTAPVPRHWAGQTATFLWIAGIGANLGNKHFDLYLNGEKRFTFSTRNESSWTVKGAGGGELTFASAMRDHSGDFFGYMALTLPVAWVKPGEPLLVRIVGGQADSRAWVMIFEYPDALDYFRVKEARDVYHELSLIHLGAMRVELAGPRIWHGKTVALLAGGKALGSALLRARQGVSVAEVTIPREVQRTLPEQLIIFVEGEAVGQIDISSITRERVSSFLAEDVEFGRYVFPPGDLPDMHFKRPAMVYTEIGHLDLKVTFYDAQMNPVQKADKPGRYGAVVQAEMPDGYIWRKHVTLYCCAEDWGRDDKLTVTAEPFAAFGIPETSWKRHQEAIDEFVGRCPLHRARERTDGGVFWAGISELTAGGDLPDYEQNPWYRDRQWWVEFKRKQYGAADKYPQLARPIELDAPTAPVIHEGDPAAAGYTDEHLSAIRKVCQEWSDEAQEPLVALIAHKGGIVFHEAFGTKPDGEAMTVDSPSWMASITKLLTGTLLMQFVDQGLIALDDPVSEYLPELGRKVKLAPTIRHLVTHTAGLSAAGSWAGDWRHSAENNLGAFLPYLKVAEEQQYTGIGYAIAGKVMERISGRAWPYLLQELLVQPLALTNTRVEGTAGDCTSVCLDMARVGQMLLNGGTYGNYQFFSEATLEKMLPVPIGQLIPGAEVGMWGVTSWGAGVTWRPWPGLGDKAIGHGAVSGAMLLVDPEHELVVVCCRYAKGTEYPEYRNGFTAACTAPFNEGEENGTP